MTGWKTTLKQYLSIAAMYLAIAVSIGLFWWWILPMVDEDFP